MQGNCVLIRSEDMLEDVEHHFRVTAGPGAGKTHWLVNHVCNVARVSKRLTPCSQIGVISYTNVAVREILRRLGVVAESADVSTIHSFLFRNLVRPYLHLLRNDSHTDLVAHHLVDTHTEHFVAHNHLETLLTSANRRQLLLQNWKHSLDLLKKRLGSLAVRIKDDSSVYFAPFKTEARDAKILDLLTHDRILEYKKPYWEQGIIAHEDVLYFAYRLLHEYPLLRRFLSERFPYIFIDEFQDTLPVQAALVRWLSNEGTIVGVIGDPEQAIFGFIDAESKYFHDFNLPGAKSYEMSGNRRSTKSITAFLNRVRSDGLQQSAIRDEIGTPPTAIFGGLSEALEKAKSISRYADSLLVLSRDHKGVLSARRSDGNATNDPWESIEAADRDRYRILVEIVGAVDLGRRQLFDSAVQRLLKGISRRKSFREPFKFTGEFGHIVRCSASLAILQFMLSNHETFKGKTVLDVYSELQAFVPTILPGLTLPTARRGKFCDATSNVPYSCLADGLRSFEETRLERTIHQAKGEEAKAVFVILSSDSTDHILQPINGVEEQRITYVAVSRAQEELYLYIPDSEKFAAFDKMGVTKEVVEGGELTPRKAKKGAPKTKRE